MKKDRSLQDESYQKTIFPSNGYIIEKYKLQANKMETFLKNKETTPIH
jgi:hypothetical protein